MCANTKQIRTKACCITQFTDLEPNSLSLAYICFLPLQFSSFYIGGFVVIMFGLILYNIISVPEGGTDQSVFSIGYWYNYGHSLFYKWRYCPSKMADDIHDNDSSERESLIGVSS